MDLVNQQAVFAHGARNRLKSWGILLAMGGLSLAAVYVALGEFALAVFAGLVVGFVGYQRKISSEDVLKLHRAERIQPGGSGRLAAVVQELARRARLARVPDLYYVPSRLKNAFSVGHGNDSAIAITDGLFRSLNERELVGVMAHEVAHIRNGDLKMLQLSDSITRYTAMLSRIAQFMLLFFLPLAILSGQGMAILGIAILLLLPGFNQLMQLSLSRTREYQADLGAVELTGDPIGLASALQKLEQASVHPLARLFGLRRRQPTREESILQSHPVTEERISRLLEMTDQRAAGLLA